MDEIAKRMLTLDHTPLHTYTGYRQLSAIKVGSNLHGEKKAINGVCNGIKVLLNRKRSPGIFPARQPIRAQTN